MGPAILLLSMFFPSEDYSVLRSRLRISGWVRFQEPFHRYQSFRMCEIENSKECAHKPSPDLNFCCTVCIYFGKWLIRSQQWKMYPFLHVIPNTACNKRTRRRDSGMGENVRSLLPVPSRYHQLLNSKQHYDITRERNLGQELGRRVWQLLNQQPSELESQHARHRKI